MKKTIIALLVCVTVSLVSCLDTEEKITLNADKSGTYQLSIDLGGMLEQLKSIKPDEAQALEGDKDTVIYFKSFTDTSSVLTVEEKKLLSKGSLHITMKSVENEMKMAFTVPFADVKQLLYLKQNMFQLIDKLKPEKNLFGDNPSGMEDDADNMPDGAMDMPKPNAGNLLNPTQNAFTFNIENNTISNKLTDKDALTKGLTADSSMQMIMQMIPFMGDLNYKTIFVLPSPVKKYSGGAESVLSDDKKTITFTNSLSGLMETPESFEYSIEY